MSRLKTIMEKQAELQARVDDRYLSNNPKVRAEYMRDHFVYLDQELQEALYEMPFFKRWKDYSDMTEEQAEVAWEKVKMELIDALHFFVNLLLCAGMSAEEVYQMYIMKNIENHRRQDAGYTSGISYKDQSVEDVMNAEPTCTVIMDGEVKGSSDFVAVMFDTDGSVGVRWNTDLISLYAAYKLLAFECEKKFAEAPAEERDAILKALDSIEVGGVQS